MKTAEITPMQIINTVEGYNRLKSKLYKDRKDLTEIEIFDSAFEDTSQQADEQKEVVKADLYALQQFLNLDMDHVPNIMPEFISEQNNKLGTKLNLEV